MTASKGIILDRAPPGTEAKRVDEVADLMRNLLYVRGKTYKELAEKWGISESYARVITAKASKKVLEDVPVEALKADLTTKLLKVTDEAMEGPLRNRKMLMFAAKLLVDIAPGLRAPQENTLNIKHGDGLPDDPDELRKLAEKMLAREAREGHEMVMERVDDGVFEEAS